MAINPSGLLTWGPSGPGGLSSLHGLALKNSGPNDAGTLAQVAIEAETLFLTYLLENLRKSLVGSLKSSPSVMQGYQSLVDQNLARSMAMGGGLGLARRLYSDLGAQNLKAPKEATDGEQQPQYPSKDPDTGRDVPLSGTP